MTEEVGIAIPATMGVLGLAFIGCALVIAGLPPLSGFIAKFALLTAALNPSAAPAQAAPFRLASWALLVVLILSGLAALIAMTRAGIRAFWAAPDRDVPRVRVIEMAPVAILLILCAMQTIQAGPVMRFMQATAQSLHAPQDYVRGVLGAVAERPASSAGGDMTQLLPFPLMSAGLLSCGCCSTSRFRWGTSSLAASRRSSAAGRFAALEPPKARLRRPGAILRLSALVLADIVRSNIAVARIVLGPWTARANVRAS